MPDNTNKPNIRHGSSATPMLASADREREYTNLIKEIVKDSGTLHWLKIVYFWIILGILSTVCFGSMIVLVSLSFKRCISEKDIVIAISGLASLLSTIIILPKIMAKHIFPENYEKSRYEFVNNMQRVDRANSELPPPNYGNSNSDIIFDADEKVT